MVGKWLEALREEEGKHNAAHALDEKSKTPITTPSKTSNTPIRRETPNKNRETPVITPSKTSETSEADRLGLVASWSGEFGFISIHDPTTGEWWDLHWKDVPEWARWEAKKRKRLYKDGDRRAHRLTSREIGEIWAADNPSSVEEGIVEEHPVEEGIVEEHPVEGEG